MQQKFAMAVLTAALVVIGCVPGLLMAQVSLDDQLKAQYNLVKMGQDSNGAAVTEAGTILSVKKGGILSVPYGDTAVATKYQDGTVHSPNALGMKARGSLLGKFGKQQTTQFFQAGTKVYPSKIQVNADKDQVVMSIVACDSCNNTSPTTFNKADVVFQFNKGALATMSAPQVEDAIAGLLAIDDKMEATRATTKVAIIRAETSKVATVRAEARARVVVKASRIIKVVEAVSNSSSKRLQRSRSRLKKARLPTR